MVVQPKVRGKFHVKLNMGVRPIAHKYREGKMQRTLKRELKVLEIAEGEAVAAGVLTGAESPSARRRLGGRTAVRLPAFWCGFFAGGHFGFGFQHQRERV